MVVRRLDKSEHMATRSLWEEVFSEDTKAFLDYYYYIKTRENQIYVVEEDGRLCSMLQLNPYRVRIGEKEFPSDYIIAVATRKPYRSRGFMGALLRTSLENMYERRLPFTFLMPAAEAIYRPYDFRYIYSQDTGEIPRRQASQGRISEETSPGICHNVVESDARLWEAEELSEFFREHFAPSWQVCTVRDADYYQTMILEQSSQKGGVRLLREDGRLRGVYAYAAESGLEIREPLYLEGFGKEFCRSVRELAGTLAPDSQEAIPVYACPLEFAAKKKPLIMARIVYLPALLEAMETKESDTVECSFAVIDPVLRKNSRVWKVTSRPGESQIHICETEDSEGVIPIADLTEVLFGRAGLPDIRERDGVILSDHLERELDKIIKLDHVWLNEVV